VAVSDGQMLYAADIAHGGLKDRIFPALDIQDPPLGLWWVSVHGIYRPGHGTWCRIRPTRAADRWSQLTRGDQGT
jgi:hypothetical protein